MRDALAEVSVLSDVLTIATRECGRDHNGQPKRYMILDGKYLHALIQYGFIRNGGIFLVLMHCLVVSLIFKKKHTNFFPFFLEITVKSRAVDCLG